MIKTGTVVTWTSQAHGSARRKTGTVIAYVPAGSRAYDYLPPEVPHRKCARIKFEPRSYVDRYLVAVPRPSGLLDYYCPLATVLEAQNPDAPREERT